MTSPREVEIGPLVAEVHFSTALEDLVPSRFLPHEPTTDTPWIFSGGATTATHELVARWPISGGHLSFRHAFRVLMETPERDTGLSAALAHDNPDPPPPPTAWDTVAAQNQLQYLHALTNEVALTVQQALRAAGRLDAQRHMLCFHGLCDAPVRTTDALGQHAHTGPPAPGCVCHVRKSQPPRARRHTPIVSYATTAAQDTPARALETRLQILLGQLAANLARRRRRPPRAQAQEAFVVALHGPHLHILHGRFSAREIAAAWAGRPPRGHRFRVAVSEDYNMLENWAGGGVCVFVEWGGGGGRDAGDVGWA